MINKLFNNKVENLLNKSSKILDVFTKTKTDLELVNEEIKSEINIRQEEIDKLSTVGINNSKIITKIDSFLN